MSINEDANRWAGHLRSWINLPVDSPEWDHIDGFTSALRDLAASKLAEREAGRNTLRSALTGLVGEFGTDLKYFDVNTISWNAGSVSWERAHTVAALVLGLTQELTTRRALQNRPADHYAEAKQLRLEIAAIEDSTFGHIAGLNDAFSGQTHKGHVAEPVAKIAPMIVEAVVPKNIEPAAPLSEMTVEGDLHSVLNADQGKYSPLTIGQEQAIIQAGVGVNMIMASGALGFEHLQEAAAHIHTVIGTGGGAFGAAPPSLATEQDVYQWIVEFATGHSETDGLFVIQPAALSAPNIVDRFKGALKYCNENPSRQLRMLFLLAPGAVWSWYSLLETDRAEVGGQLHSHLKVQPWTQGAIRDRLERQNKKADTETCRLAFEATGGWPWCVDKLFEICGNESDILPAIQKVTAGLKNGGPLHDEFLMRIGVRPNTPPRFVLDLIQSEGEIPIELVAPDMLVGKATEAECRSSVEFLQAMQCVTLANGLLKVDPLLAKVMAT